MRFFVCGLSILVVILVMIRIRQATKRNAILKEKPDLMRLGLERANNDPGAK